MKLTKCMYCRQSKGRCDFCNLVCSFSLYRLRTFIYFDRYLVYLQIRRDLTQGRLLCPPSIVGKLGALVAQGKRHIVIYMHKSEYVSRSFSTDFYK